MHHKAQTQIYGFPKWTQHSEKARRHFGMSRYWRPWTAPSDASRVPHLFGVSGGPRVIELLDIAWGARLTSNAAAAPKEQMQVQDLKRDYYANISQSVDRSPWGSLPTVARGADIFSCV